MEIRGGPMEIRGVQWRSVVFPALIELNLQPANGRPRVRQLLRSCGIGYRARRCHLLLRAQLRRTYVPAPRFQACTGQMAKPAYS